MYYILKLNIKIKLLIIKKNKLLIRIKAYLKISLKIHFSTPFRLIIIFRI